MAPIWHWIATAKTMIEALQDKESGRPSKPHDPQKEGLQKRLEDLEERERIRQQVEHIRSVVDESKTAAEKKMRRYAC